MQAVDVLGRHRADVTVCLQGRKGKVGGIGFRGQCRQDDLFPMEAKEFRGMLTEEGTAEHHLGWIVVALVVKAILAAKIRNAAFRRYPRAPEEHHVVATIYHLAQLGDPPFQALVYGVRPVRLAPLLRIPLPCALRAYIVSHGHPLSC